MFKNKSNTKHDDRDYDKGHDNDRNWGKKDNIWDCDNGFYGRPHYQQVVVQKAHKFAGNKFHVTLQEGVAIDANEQKQLGIKSGNLDVNDSTVIAGKITFKEALFENTLGVFTTKKDGTINAVEFVVKDTGAIGATFEVEAGDKDRGVGFFLVADGEGKNNNYNGLDFANGELNFVYNFGLPGERDAKVTDSGNNVTLVFTAANSTETVIQGNVWFTNERGESNSLNKDGMQHALSGVKKGSDCETLTIAFEDVEKGHSDLDYNDTVFDVQLYDEKVVCKPIKCCDVIDRGCDVDKAINDFVYSKDKGDCTPPPVNCNTNQVTAAAILSVPTQDDQQHVSAV